MSIQTEPYVIVLLADDTKAKKVLVEKTELASREEWFPSNKVPMCLDRIECQYRDLDEDGLDQLCVFFDGHNNGKYNPIAKWIARFVGVPPTGNFVICRNKWNKDEQNMCKIPINLSLQEIKTIFKN